MKEPLKKVLREHYASRSLDDGKLAALRAQLDQRPRGVVGRRGALLGILGLAFAAVLAVVVVLRDTPYSVENVAAEISYNHNKRMDLEVISNSIDDLRAKLPKLDFALVASERLPAEQWELVGARYCSIHGRVASQMRYRNRRNGQYYTLYETAFPAPLGSLEGEQSIYKDGNLVRIWREKDLLLGLAGPELP